MISRKQRLNSLLFAHGLEGQSFSRSRNICLILRTIAHVGHARFRKMVQVTFDQFYVHIIVVHLSLYLHVFYSSTPSPFTFYTNILLLLLLLLLLSLLLLI